jgi:multidrug resistance efflux pump
MAARTQQTRVIVNDQENRDILHVRFEAPFVFKAAAEAGRFQVVVYFIVADIWIPLTPDSTVMRVVTPVSARVSGYVAAVLRLVASS